MRLKRRGRLPFPGQTIYFIYGRNVERPILLLTVIAAARGIAGSKEILGVYGLGSEARVFFEVFIVGMIGAYWYYGSFLKNRVATELAQRYHHVISALGIFSLAAVIAFSMNYFSYTLHQLSRILPIPAAMVCLVVTVTALLSRPGSIYLRILQNPLLRYIGIIGYSFYLLHPTVLFLLQRAVRHFHNVPLQDIAQGWWIAGTAGRTLLFASFTCTFIERPFLTRR